MKTRFGATSGKCGKAGRRAEAEKRGMGDWQATEVAGNRGSGGDRDKGRVQMIMTFAMIRVSCLRTAVTPASGFLVAPAEK